MIGVDGLVIGDAILATNAGGLVTRDAAPTAVTSSLVARATIFSHPTFNTNDSSGWDTGFGSLLEIFYLTYQTLENILLKIFLHVKYFTSKQTKCKFNIAIIFLFLLEKKIVILSIEDEYIAQPQFWTSQILC